MDQAAHHDAYAADYDHEVEVYGCYLAEALFGLSYASVRPGQSLLDLGIGTGLSAQLFARAGLAVYGMDFSPAMLDLCRAKGCAVDLKQGDVLSLPWPYPPKAFEHGVCCGVLHFIPDLEAVFSETARVLREGGLFAFTTKSPLSPAVANGRYERVSADGLDVFSHAPAYIEALIRQSGFQRRRDLRCFVGQDIFQVWLVIHNTSGGNV